MKVSVEICGENLLSNVYRGHSPIYKSIESGRLERLHAEKAISIKYAITSDVILKF